MRDLVLGALLALVPTLDAAWAQAPEPARKAYGRVLARHVQDGRVDYDGVAGDKDLAVYLSAVADASLPKGKNAKIAFYVNAYNALVLQAVVDNGKPRSVLDVDGFFDAKTHRVAGKVLTLDQLEKKVLNPLAQDPRTHFVLVCGAVGCPILEAKPFTADDINARMTAATRRYLASPFGARVTKGKLSLSKIFDWYAADFGGKEKVRAFALAHLSKEARQTLTDTFEIAFFDYNWTLNQQ